MNARFEGSYGGEQARISDSALLECKICWTPYDPALGDETRMIPPGTPFRALPDDWRCPTCSAPKAQFMVTSDAASGDAPEAAEQPAARAADPSSGDARDSVLRARLVTEPPKLVAEFREIWNGKMRDVPIVNRSLHVEAVGFRIWDGRLLGALVTPWFMNLFALPGPGDDWSGLVAGAKEDVAFPSGVYEFIANSRPMIGPYKACSLFSPMQDFASQLQATDVARAAMVALFDPKNRAETSRQGEIRAAREAELDAVAAAQAAAATAGAAPSRRAVISGGLAADAPSDRGADAT